MSEIIIWNPIERGLWAIFTFMAFLMTLIYLQKGREYKNTEDKEIFLGFAIIFLAFGLNRMFFFLSDLQVIGIFRNGLFYGDFEQVNQLFFLLDRLGYITLVVGMIFLVFIVKNVFKRSRYPIMLLNSVIVILIIFLPYELARTFTILAVFISNGGIFYLFVYLMIRSKMEFRAISSIMLGGYILIGCGTVLYMTDVKTLNLIPLELAPILAILGQIIMLSPFLLNPLYFRNAQLYWTLIGSSVTILCFSIWIFFIIKQIPWVLNLAFLVFTMFTGITFYKSMTIIKSSKSITDGEEGENTNILSMFTRAKDITEEEITISKEKRICLVCKNKLKGNIFMCGNCGAYYCSKCAIVLEKEENACWVCEAAFDSSKPRKKESLEDQQISVDEKVHKSKKPLKLT